jgi:hypothetical protein
MCVIRGGMGRGVAVGHGVSVGTCVDVGIRVGVGRSVPVGIVGANVTSTAVLVGVAEVGADA